MERPSHIDVNMQQSLSHRTVLVGLAVSFQIAVFWLIGHGLMGGGIHLPPGPIHFVDVHTLPAPPDASPVPVLKPVVVPRVPLPIISVDPGPEAKTITATVTPPTGGTTTSAAGPDRAPVGILATHTVPPYPVIARRMGAEGRVILRLTVLADGHVGRCEIVTSSGREDLDQAAQAWIVAHWAYRPALDKGQPVAGQTLASVVFSLPNASPK